MSNSLDDDNLWDPEIFSFDTDDDPTPLIGPEEILEGVDLDELDFDEGPPKNNDGRYPGSCFWCGGELKCIYGLTRTYHVCTSCGR